MIQAIEKVLSGDSDGCIVCGDCLEVMADMPDGCVDAVVTDPPFGIGFKYNSYKDSPEGYGGWLWSVCEDAERLLTEGGVMFVWQAMSNVRQFPVWFPREWRLFAAAKNFVQMRKCAMQYSYDPVVVWWKEGEIWYAGTTNRDFHVANTNPSSRKTTEDDVPGHPCPRPLGQLVHIVEQWARPGIVLDPFCGSGTTCVAAKKLGRRYIGIEIDEGYCDIARDRLLQLDGKRLGKLHKHHGFFDE